VLFRSLFPLALGRWALVLVSDGFTESHACTRVEVFLVLHICDVGRGEADAGTFVVLEFDIVV
jgi:hypothetical protein